MAPMAKKLMLRMAAKDSPRHKDSFSACEVGRGQEGLNSVVFAPFVRSREVMSEA